MTTDSERKKKRRRPAGSVCKPCWELKYCPYGFLVEYFPLLGGEKDAPGELEALHARALKDLQTASPDDDAFDVVRHFLFTNPATWREMEQYDPDEVGCKIFGHVCPVFVMQSGATETREGRKNSRYVPRSVMLQVVRRDNHICQECFTYVRDDELEFDHIIPIARGGPTSVANLRLLCRSCNNRKSDHIDSLLGE